MHVQKKVSLDTGVNINNVVHYSTNIYVCYMY